VGDKVRIAGSFPSSADDPVGPVFASGVRWRILRHDEAPPAWNMAVDMAIQDAVIAGIAPPTLRLYRWSDVAISLGRFQSLDAMPSVETCQAAGITVVRRPTGGRAILHGEDQTVSLTLPQALLGPSGGTVAASYPVMNRGLVLGLRALDIRVTVGRGEPRGEGAADCFAARTRCDLLTGAGNKLLGSAQCRRSGVILQQSSLLHRRLVPEVWSALAPSGFAPPVDLPLADVDEWDLGDALARGFVLALGGRSRPEELTMWETERASVLMLGLTERPIIDMRPGV